MQSYLSTYLLSRVGRNAEPLLTSPPGLAGSDPYFTNKVAERHPTYGGRGQLMAGRQTPLYASPDRATLSKVADAMVLPMKSPPQMVDC